MKSNQSGNQGDNSSSNQPQKTNPLPDQNKKNKEASPSERHFVGEDKTETKEGSTQAENPKTSTDLSGSNKTNQGKDNSSGTAL